MSTHFRRSEFACKCGCGFGLNSDDVSIDLIKRLEEIRAHFGKPVFITSACRCAKHNRSVGGASHSQHLLGTAADIIVRDVSPADVYNYVSSHYSNGGTGKYRLFTHVDVRKDKRFWNGSA